MRKKIFALILVIALMASLLSACDLFGGGRTVTPPTSGRWNGDVFTSEYLGLRLDLPPSWDILTAADIALFQGAATPMMEASGVTMPDDVDSIHDIYVMNYNTGANIQIIFERVPGRSKPSVEELIDGTIELIEEMGASALRLPGVTHIGGYEWHAFNTEMSVLGTTMYGRQYISYHEGFARAIIFTYSAGAEDFDIMLSLLSSLSAPEEAQRATEMVGSWSWEYDDEYVMTFIADGTGFRGWPGEQESFTWETIGESQLLLSGEMMVENWTFNISGNALTINSRQVPEIHYTYIRN